jgi:alcohol dehydrogenase YqhD (iron-dependent ADH family)
VQTRSYLFILVEFFFKTLGLKSTLSEIGIDDSKFSIMAQKACMGGVLPAFKNLNQQDIETILKMCK